MAKTSKASKLAKAQQRRRHPPGKPFERGRSKSPAGKRQAVNIRPKAPEGKSTTRIARERCLSPIMGSAAAAGTFLFSSFGASDLIDAAAVLTEIAERVKAGDLSDLESMLTAQSMALNTIFGELARLAASNMAERLPTAETYLRLALQAQAQCRTTVQAVAEIKNPSPVFLKQAEIRQDRK